MLEANEKAMLPVALGNAIAHSPLEALIMRGHIDANGYNGLESCLASMFPVSDYRGVHAKKTRSIIVSIPPHCGCPRCPPPAIEATPDHYYL